MIFHNSDHSFASYPWPISSFHISLPWTLLIYSSFFVTCPLPHSSPLPTGASEGENMLPPRLVKVVNCIHLPLLHKWPLKCPWLAIIAVIDQAEKVRCPSHKVSSANFAQMAPTYGSGIVGICTHDLQITEHHFFVWLLGSAKKNIANWVKEVIAFIHHEKVP